MNALLLPSGNSESVLEKEPPPAAIFILHLAMRVYSWLWLPDRVPVCPRGRMPRPPHEAEGE